jgi:transcriptional regulator with XRE-family HTH domain
MDASRRPCDAAAMPPKLPADPALGRAIRQLRELRGLTQEELATHAGMTFGTVSRLESAKSAPAWATVRALIETLNVSFGELAVAIEAQERAR